MNDKKTFMDYLADIGGWVLGIAMFIYLAYRTLNFLEFTFTDQDQMYKYLGLFSTTVGAVIFAIIFKRSFYFDRRARVWRSDEFRKAVSATMMVVCALGEVGLAFADMSIVTAMKTGVVTLSEGEINTFIWLTAGLAGLVGAAIAAIKLTAPHPKTDPEIDMSELDADNNGIFDRNEKKNKGSNQRPAPVYNQTDQQPQYKAYTLNDLLHAIGMNKDEIRAAMKEQGLIGETETRQALKQMGRWPSDLSNNNFKKLFDELNGHKVNP